MNLPLDEWSGSKATTDLQRSLEEQHAVSSRQTRTMLRLTWLITVLTAATLALVVVQAIK